MRAPFELLPSPLTGEGTGGGEDSPFSPHPNLPPPRGEGALTYPCQPAKGGGQRFSGHAHEISPLSASGAEGQPGDESDDEGEGEEECHA
jgi:hypothetical protein